MRSARTGGEWDTVATATEQEAEAQWYAMTWPPDKQTAETAGAAIGGVAAAGACTAMGAAIASPICAAIGQWVGEAIGGLIYDGVETLIGAFGGAGSGHPFGHFAVYAWECYQRLELQPPKPTFSVDDIYSYLRSIGIDFRPSSYAGGRYAYGCSAYQGSLLIDGKTAYRYTCWYVEGQHYGQESSSGYALELPGGWWSEAERVMLARMAAQAAVQQTRLRLAPKAALSQVRLPQSESTDSTALVIGGIGLLGLGALAVKAWL